MTAFGWYRPWLTDIQSSDMPSRAKAIAAVLATNERGAVVQAATARLGRLASLDPKTARAALDELEADGWIRRRRSRNCVVVELLARTGATPALDSENGSHARSENGSHARSRTGATPDVSTEGPTNDIPPRPPASGGRRRDHDRFEAECAIYADQHFPDLNGSGAAAVKQAVTYGKAQTLDEVTAIVDGWWRARRDSTNADGHSVR